MARVTVEDCLENVDNRFELVILASVRARRLAQFGEEPTVPWENDKPTVVALREIAEGNIDISYLTKPAQPAPEETTEAVEATGTASGESTDSQEEVG